MSDSDHKIFAEKLLESVFSETTDDARNGDSNLKTSAINDDKKGRNEFTIHNNVYRLGLILCLPNNKVNKWINGCILMLILLFSFNSFKFHPSSVKNNNRINSIVVAYFSKIKGQFRKLLFLHLFSNQNFENFTRI